MTHILSAQAKSAGMTQPAVVSQRTVGVDLAKASFAVAIYDGNSTYIEGTFDNTAKGHGKFHSFLRKHHALDALVAMEATGNLYKALAKHLVNQGRRVSVVNPTCIHNYAKSQLKRNKTDPADARTIANYAATQSLRLWSAPSPEAEELQTLSRCRGDLVAEQTRVKNRLQANPSSNTVRASLKAQRAFLEEQIAEIERAIKELLKQHPELERATKLLITIPGVAWVTAVTVLAELPELALFTSARQLAAYAGLTPARNQSGKKDGKAHLSRIGSRRLRTALYMASLIAQSCNPLIKPFAERLKNNGKSRKTVIAASMRKLLHIIYGVLKSGQPFNPNLLADAA